MAAYKNPFLFFISGTLKDTGYCKIGNNNETADYNGELLTCIKVNAILSLSINVLQ